MWFEDFPLNVKITLGAYTFTPWVVRWEKEMARQLISAKMRNTVYVKFNMAGLLRGDLASRYAAYAVGRQGGWLSVNDIRELEEMNPVPDGDGYLEPVNMKPLGEPTPEPAPLVQTCLGLDPGAGVRHRPPL